MNQSCLLQLIMLTMIMIRVYSETSLIRTLVPENISGLTMVSVSSSTVITLWKVIRKMNTNYTLLKGWINKNEDKRRLLVFM